MNRVLRALPFFAAFVLLAVPTSAAAALAGSTFLVSRPDGTGPVAAASDNVSTGPLAVSANGRYVAFISQADGFAPGADSRFYNLFVRDTATGTTTLASRSDGPNGVGVDADVEFDESAQIGIVVQPGATVMDGPHDRPHVIVVFATKATNLVDHADRAVPPTGNREQVWLRDVTAGTTYLISRASTLTGAPADGPSLEPSIAVGPHGPLVAFVSKSTNLSATGPVAATSTIYLRQVSEGVTRLVSCLRSMDCTAPRGFSAEPSIQYVSGLGAEMCPLGERCAMVAFTTADPGIAGAGATEVDTQIIVGSAFEKDDGSGFEEFTRWRLGSAIWRQPARPGDGPSKDPTLSADGIGVAFISQATNLDPFGPSLPPQPTEGYLHLFDSQVTLLETTGKDGNGALVGANAPVRHVSVGTGPAGFNFGFDTGATNLGVSENPFGRIRAYSIFPALQLTTSFLDRGNGTGGVLGDGRSEETVISADGTTAVFLSDSTNLDAGGGRDFPRVYKRRVDPTAPEFETLQLASRPSGTGAFSAGAKRANIPSSAISADGRFVAFESTADDLSTADDNRFVNVFVRDTVNGTTALVSRAGGAGGAAADASSKLNGISEDGQRILFTTGARSLGVAQPGDHAYVRDLAAQTTTVVTRVNGPTGTIAPGIGASISGDGNRVAFLSGFQLDPESNDEDVHLYIRDLGDATTTFADRENGPTGHPAERSAEEASLNRDGSRVAWTTFSTLSVPEIETTGVRRIFVRDLDKGTTVLASRADGPAGEEPNGESASPALNAAGDIVAFESTATNLASTPVTDRAIWLRRLGTGRTELVSRVTGASGDANSEPAFDPSIDAGGERVAFVSRSQNLTAKTPNEEGPRVHGFLAFVRDMKAKTTEVASRVNGVNGASADPGGEGGVSISASGDCVAFAGTGLNYTDALAGADFPQVRERVLRNSCGPSSIPATGVAAEPPAPLAATLSRMAMRPTRFHVGGPEGGTRISFELSEAAPVTLTFDRLVVKKGEQKLLARRVGRLTVQGRAGTNAVHFSGRLRGRALASGRYRWTAAPLHGVARSGRFAVLRAPSK